MNESLHHELVSRLFRLLGPHIEADDKDASDSEFLYRLKKRFDIEWNRKQAIIDPNE